MAVFAGGCFWGVQGVYQHVTGVTSAVSGYAGGDKRSASYDAVGRGDSGHAEAVRITYDPRQVSYGTLLQIFFSVAHDPTELNRQGPDVGTQYRSAVFPADTLQAQRREGLHRPVERGPRLRGPDRHDHRGGPAVLSGRGCHQDYLTLHPNQPYIVIHDLPKIAELKRLFPTRFRDAPTLVRTRRG